MQDSHLCLLYESRAEHLAVLASFHRDGLSLGHRCIHVTADDGEADFHDALRGVRVDPEHERNRGALRVHPADEVYLRDGFFDTERTLAFWHDALETALADGFSGLTISGDTGPMCRDDETLERFEEYEARVQETLHDDPMRALCCYDRRHFPTEGLAYACCTHDKVILGDDVLEMPSGTAAAANGNGEVAGTGAGMATAGRTVAWLAPLLRKLRESEDEVRGALELKEQLFEVTPAGIYTCDAEGLITAFNPAAEKIWGRAPRLGEPDDRFCGSFRLSWPDGRPLPHADTPMAIAIREGRPARNARVVIERPDGRHVSVLANVAPLRGPDGAVTGAINCFVDITPELERRRQEREYFRLLQNLPAAAYTCDADGLITFYNDRAEEVWGRAPKLNDPADRFCGSVRMLTPGGEPLDRDGCWLALALRNDRDYQGEEMMVERPDGSRVNVLAYAHPLHDERGEVTGAVNVLVDVTERRRAAEAQARAAAIVESAEDAIMSKDLEGMITSWNRGAERLFGYSAEEAVGRAVHMLVPPDRRDEERMILDNIRAGRRTDTLETVRCRKDGTPVQVSLTVSPLMDARGRVIGASTVARDITRRKKAEEALRAADRQKDEFLAMLAHELRNPLAPIRSSVELLGLETLGPEEQGRALEALDRQVRSLARLVDDLVDVSRVTSGRIRIAPEDTDMVPLVRCIANSHRAMFDAKGQEFSVSLPPDPLPARVDSTRFEQVIVNLLSNACKYTPDGGHVWLELDRDEDEAVLRVRDDGAGIDPELAPRLFELFAQGKRPLDRADSGLGVGLALARRLVERHGGTIRARSDGPGRGSEFEVRLPVTKEKAKGAADHAPSAEAPARDRESAAMSAAPAAAGSENGTAHAAPAAAVSEATSAPTPSRAGAAPAAPPTAGNEAASARWQEVDASDAPTDSTRRATPDPTSSRDGESRSAPAAEPARSGEKGPLRVLCVDDHPDTRELAELVLGTMGYEVAAAGDGKAAIEAAREFRPHVALLDIGLPGMDGYEAARRIRSDPELAGIVLVAITGYANATDRARSKEAGFDHHMVKPVDYMRTVRALLERVDAERI